MRILKDSSGSSGELIPAYKALIKTARLSSFAITVNSRYFFAETLRALHTPRPAQPFQIFETCFLSRKFCVDI